MSVKNLKPPVSIADTRTAKSGVVNRIRGGRLVTIRKRILKRDNYLCQICWPVETTLAEEVDHITPLWAGGAESDANRQSTCKECHRVKSEREEKERLG